MPRSRSMSILSRYCARICRASTTPVSWSIRSARVDLPWSMWAMMQKLRITAGSVVGTSHCHLLQAGHLDRHAERVRAPAGEQPLQRRHVGVVTATSHDDVPLTRRHPVRRVVRPPAAEPDLDPRVALAGERLPDRSVGLG